MKLPLESKLGLNAGVLIAAMLLSALVAHLRIREVNRLTGDIIGSRMPVILQVRDMRRSTLRSVQALEAELLFAGTGDRTGDRNLDHADGSGVPYRLQRAQQMAEANSVVSRLQANAAGMDLADDLPRLDALHGEILALTQHEEETERLCDAHRPRELTAARALLAHDVLPLQESIFDTVGLISDSQKDKAEAASRMLRQANEETLATLWIATALGILLGTLVSVALGRHITGAIGLVVGRANAIAAGDLTGDALHLETGDQVGTLAEAIDRMQASLGSVIGTMVQTVGSLGGSAGSMQGASDGIHRRMDQQSQQTQQAATAMQEMSASIAEVSRHTQNAAETARGAAQTARDGGAIVTRMLDGMQEIATAVSETSATVGLLGEDSRRISQIVTVIDEIARKTNLLALNAAIEAARAGEQGRGFAVVAGEVRRLAESTAQANGEIGAMVHGIQERTRVAIASMESGTGTVRDGVVTTRQAGEALERIIGMAERVDRMIAQIAIAASQQAAAADQSSASLDRIHVLSGDNLQEMATTAAGIENLRGTAMTLAAQVDRFSLAGLRHAPAQG